MTSRSKKLFPAIPDRIQGLAYLVLLLLGFALLGDYLMAAKPGITPEGWRAILVPYHPSVALAGANSMADQDLAQKNAALEQARRRGAELRTAGVRRAQSDDYFKHIGLR